MYASERLNVGKDVLTTDPLLQDVDAESVKRLMEKANTIQGFLVLV